MSLRGRRRTTILFFLAVLLLAAGFYYIFDTFLRTTGEEIAKAWYYGEVVNLQEGQILPAIAKNQNLFEKSPFIRSVVLVDLKDPDRTLFSVGETARAVSREALSFASHNSEVISSFRSGFLSYRLLVGLPGPNALFIVYDISSGLLTWAYFFTLAISILFATYLINVTVQVTNAERKKRDEFRRDLLKRLAHDVNSPLLTISSLSLKAKKWDQDLHIKLEQATESIRRLLAQTDKVDKKLLDDANGSPSAIDQDTDLIPLAAALKELVIQKRGEYSSDDGIKLDLSIQNCARSAFVKINIDDFKRHISNILKNSVEATSGRARREISMTIAADTKFAEISISDTGCGIPVDLLGAIGKKGVSGKTGGQGLGLYFAMVSLKHWQGEFKIASDENVGTTITMRLPLFDQPSWYASAIHADHSTKLVFVDDDITMIDRWKNRLQLSDRAYLSFNSAMSFRNWFNKDGQFEDNLMFVFDYHLDNQNTGLGLIDELGISKESILVTSAYLDEQVLSKAKDLGVQVMPKVLV